MREVGRKERKEETGGKEMNKDQYKLEVEMERENEWRRRRRRESWNANCAYCVVCPVY